MVSSCREPSQDNPLPQKKKKGKKRQLCWVSSLPRASLIFTLPAADCFTKGDFPSIYPAFSSLYFLPPPALLTLPFLISMGEIFHFIFWQQCWFLKIVIISITSDSQFPRKFLPILLRKHLCNYRQQSQYFSMLLPLYVLHILSLTYHWPPLIMASDKWCVMPENVAFPSPIIQLSFGGCWILGNLPWRALYFLLCQ